MTIGEKQQQLVREVLELGDCFNQYAYLVSCAGKLPPLPEQWRREEQLVKGCQSQVWLYLQLLEDGTLALWGDSDTLILKGILYLLSQVISGCTPGEVEGDPLDFLGRTELTVTFTSQRSAGLNAMLSTIRRQAARYL